MKVTIELSEDDFHALRTACETYMRIGMGQFAEVANAFKVWPDWEVKQAVENACKSLLAPELVGNSYYSISSAKVNEYAKRCYNLWKALGQPVNYYLAEVGKPPVVTIDRGEAGK